MRDPGAPRNHESYVVNGKPVRDDGTLGKPRKYWPKVSYLQLIPSEESHDEKIVEATAVVDVPLPPSSHRTKTEQVPTIVEEEDELDDQDDDDLPEELDFGDDALTRRRDAIASAMARREDDDAGSNGHSKAG